VTELTLRDRVRARLEARALPRAGAVGRSGDTGQHACRRERDARRPFGLRPVFRVRCRRIRARYASGPRTNRNERHRDRGKRIARGGERACRAGRSGEKHASARGGSTHSVNSLRQRFAAVAALRVDERDDSPNVRDASPSRTSRSFTSADRQRVERLDRRNSCPDHGDMTPANRPFAPSHESGRGSLDTRSFPPWPERARERWCEIFRAHPKRFLHSGSATTARIPGADRSRGRGRSALRTSSHRPSTPAPVRMGLRRARPPARPPQLRLAR
jgi:hypothetical protein